MMPFYYAISMSLKREEQKNASSFHTLMEKDSGVAFELICLAFKIKKEGCEILDNILFF
jgi:hypothetical protein